MEYIPLQVKTSYSLLESLNNIKYLVTKAKKLGYTSLAITDHNNMFGVMEFYNECKNQNIKPIIGLELDINNSKILLYAKNNLGYKNLIKLATIKSERDLTIDDLTTYKDNLILIIPYEYYQIDIYNLYSDKYIGYHNIEQKLKIKEDKVFINDVSYLEKEDHKYLDYLYMIKDNKVVGEYELNTNQNKYLLPLEELNHITDIQDLHNASNIVNNCNVEITYTKGLLPIYDKNIPPLEYLTELCQKGLNRRLKNNVTKIYQDRLNHELDIINKMGFCNYFLVVWDYVKYAKFNNILVGPGRGSAAGSLVSYTLGITDIDPIKYNLLFERFLNPERVTMPDIDIDFDSAKREQVIEYVTNKYGEKKVAGIITFNTLGAKQVIRDVGRVLKISLPIIDDICRQLKDTLKESLENPNLKNIIMSDSNLQKLYKISLKLEGLPRHISVHAAGIVMSNLDLDETIPIYKNQLGMYVTGYSMNYLEPLGLLKMDFLGLSNLTLISDVINNIREKEKLNITFQNIPLDDPKPLEIFRHVETDGIFQFESAGMRNFLEKLQVSSFDDLVAALALYRPGPMDNIDTYIRRKQGKEKVIYPHKDLEEILKPTYGILIYQEQIMQVAVTLAGYTLGEADILRRAMSKKKESILLEEKPKFIKRSIEKGYTKELATQVYELILKFANYGFNKSHSVAYAIIAYKMAFLKTYFLQYFLSSILTNVIGSEPKTKTYISESRNHQIPVLEPDINKSTNKYIVEDKAIRCPLSIIKNVGTTISNDIIKEREKGPYTSFIDFVKRNYTVGINKKVLTSLIKSSCFNNLGYNEKTLINNLDTIINYAEISKDVGLLELEEPLIDEFSEYSKEELIENQLSVYGFYLSEHPVSIYKKATDLSTQDIKKYFDKNITLILYIDNIKEVFTKNNDVMSFITATDEYGTISLTLFPKTYKQYNNIKKYDIIKIVGKVEKRFDKYQIIVNSLTILK
jgi:DNA polymerase-3 subunit alpha